MCLLAWATEGPDIGSNMTLGLSVRLTFRPIDWVKQVALPKAGGPHLIS